MKQLLYSLLLITVLASCGDNSAGPSLPPTTKVPGLGTEYYFSSTLEDTNGENSNSTLYTLVLSDTNDTWQGRRGVRIFNNEDGEFSDVGVYTEKTASPFRYLFQINGEGHIEKWMDYPFNGGSFEYQVDTVLETELMAVGVRIRFDHAEDTTNFTFGTDPKPIATSRVTGTVEVRYANLIDQEIFTDKRSIEIYYAPALRMIVRMESRIHRSGPGQDDWFDEIIRLYDYSPKL